MIITVRKWLVEFIEYLVLIGLEIIQNYKIRERKNYIKSLRIFSSLHFPSLQITLNIIYFFEKMLSSSSIEACRKLAVPQGWVYFQPIWTFKLSQFNDLYFWTCFIQMNSNHFVFQNQHVIYFWTLKLVYL